MNQNDTVVATDPAQEDASFLLTPPPTATAMRVNKCSGGSEPVDLNKIVRAVQRCAEGLHAVDPMRVATRTISGLYDGASTRELDELSIRTAALLTAEEPEYSRLAARLLAGVIAKEVAGQEIHAFSQSIARGHEVGLINERLLGFVQASARKLNDAVDTTLDRHFDYFGLRTLYDRYLLRHPHTRKVIETPQQFFLRIACALSEDVPEALALYERLGNLDYLPSSPTLFNAGTTPAQLSSCFLLDSPHASLDSFSQKYGHIAQLSKFSGGIGVSYTRVRSRGLLIRATNGHSNGIVPWLKTLDSSVAAVNQGGKRKGAACVYLEPWHADVQEFLELRDNTGDDARRTHNLNLANWIPDLFMRRVEADAAWSLFDPSKVPEFTDLFGEAFERAYAQAEAQGKAVKTIRARELYARMMRTLAQTGNGWMTFKDTCNRAGNQTARPGNVIHLSNLCTEILEVTSAEETAVCNLGSINLSHHVDEDGPAGTIVFDYDKLGETVRLAVRPLDRVIDLNFYPIESAPRGNLRWRPVRPGVADAEEHGLDNLGSSNPSHHCGEVRLAGTRVLRFDELGAPGRVAVRQRDRVIDLNFYPIESARRGNLRGRPVGLGVMGLQDVFFKLRLPFDGEQARALSARIAETIYYFALETSCELAGERGRHPAFDDTRAANGELQFDAWNVVPEHRERWDGLRDRIPAHGLRTPLLNRK